MWIPSLSGFKNALKTYVLSDFSLSNPFIITSYARQRLGARRAAGGET